MGTGISSSPQHSQPQHSQPSYNKYENEDLSPVVHRRALVIGINYTGDPNLQLNGCIPDANRMCDYLISIGFKDEDILVLTDPINGKPTHLPTRANIVKAINWLNSLAPASDFIYHSALWKKNDGQRAQLVVHYSGHGSNIADDNGDEMGDRRDETICPKDISVSMSNMIRDDQLRSMLVGNMNSNSRLVTILDCCNSGTGMDLPFAYKTKMEKASYNPNTSCDVICFSGCKDVQYSADTYVDGKPSGALTAAFLKFVSENPNITTSELADKSREYIKNTLNVSDQYPVISFGKYYNPYTHRIIL